MLTKIIVTSLKPKSNQSYTCIYQNPTTRKWSYLTNDGNSLVEGKVKEGDKPTRIQFGIDGIKEFILNTEDIQYRDIVAWWKQNPNSEIIGEKNPHLVIPNWTVVIESDLNHIHWMIMQEKISVINKLNKMRFRELRNVSYAIGTDPSGYTHKGLLNHLIGTTFEGDALLKKITVAGKEMLAVNALRTKKSEEMDYIVMVNKAAKLNIIVQENGVFTAIGKTLGATLESVIEFCKGNSDFYHNYLIKQVEEADVIDIDLDDIEREADVTEFNMEVQAKRTVKAVNKNAPVESPVQEPEFDDLEKELEPELVFSGPEPEPEVKKPEIAAPPKLGNPFKVPPKKTN